MTRSRDVTHALRLEVDSVLAKTIFLPSPPLLSFDPTPNITKVKDFKILLKENENFRSFFL
ncbi:hypothetical protein X975_26040, partial [Stegodyphus mimosarum]